METIMLQEYLDSSEEDDPQEYRPAKGKANENCVWKNRILSDYSDFNKYGCPWGISAQIMENDVRLWAVQIMGPLGTKYEGGYFEGTLLFSDLYPYHPPNFKFTTSMFHPNISKNGDVCVEQLYRMWSPAHTVWSFLVSIQFVLADANTDDVLNATAALYYKTDPEQFEDIVREGIAESRAALESTENTFNNLG
ncbi:ubiquitin-conjugating enzyme E2 2 [Folsomia candida]|nr:ubiquitin-conjugating enzyme E2 2 [Folsomia candida]